MDDNRYYYRRVLYYRPSGEIICDPAGMRSETLVITVTFKSIGSGAYRSCSSLKNVTIRGPVTSIMSDAFRECSGLETVTRWKQLGVMHFIHAVHSNAFIFMVKHRQQLNQMLSQVFQQHLLWHWQHIKMIYLEI